MPLRLLKERTPRAVALANFFLSMVSFSIMYNAPLYFQAVVLESAQTAGHQALRFSLPPAMIIYTDTLCSCSGLRFIPYAFVIATGSLCTGLYMRWTGRFYYLTLLSGLLTILSTALLATWRQSSPPIHLWGDILPAGLGIGSVLTTTLIGLIASVDREDVAVATGISYLFRTTGQVIGVSLSGALLQSVLVKNLHERITGPGSAEIIQSIRHSITIIPNLPPYIRQAAVESYQRSLHAVFLGQLACATLMFIALVPIEENPLPGSMEEQAEQEDLRRSRKLLAGRSVT
ncbi:hypothetical protein FRB95_002194 [Tulasnella sp. JGI-2019a]|nr:hypothetical protein FRB95_002194 [Tulasnella sp. JGI-2019a]